MQNVAASYTIEQNTPITSEYNVEQVEPFKTKFEVNTAFEIIGEGLIQTTQIGNVIKITSKTFVYEQALASDTWIIQHNLSKQPSVFAVDSSGKVQLPDDITYDTDTQITVKFLAPFSGKAYLN